MEDLGIPNEDTQHILDDLAAEKKRSLWHSFLEMRELASIVHLYGMVNCY